MTKPKYGRSQHGPLEYRLMRQGSPEPMSGCWLWTGNVTPKGYGYIGIGDKRTRSVHRTSYELFVGPIPAGLEIDHKCNVRCCVNPAHLEPVTRLENVRRSNWVKQYEIHERAQKNFCTNGHPWTPENVYIYPSGQRACRLCSNMARKRRRSVDRKPL